MGRMVWLVLWAMGALDAAMTGWRVAGGAPSARAMARGMAWGHAVLVPAALLDALVVGNQELAGLHPEQVERGALAMAAVYASFLALLALVLLPRLARGDFATAASAMVHGRWFSLVRPLVAALGVLAGYAAMGDGLVAGTVLIGVSGMLALEGHLRGLKREA